MTTLRVYSTKPTERKLVFETNPSSKTPHFDVLDKFRRFLQMRHPMAILGDVAKIADDPYLDGCAKSLAAFQLIQLVLKTVNYEVIYAEEVD